MWGPCVAEDQQGKAHAEQNPAAQAQQPAPPAQTVIEPSTAAPHGNAKAKDAEQGPPQESWKQFFTPEWVIVYITAVYVVITALMLGAIKRQAGHMKDQSKTLRKSVAAAQKAADAAETSAKAAMGVAVPTLMLHKFDFVCDPEAHDDRTFLRHPKIKVMVKNFGKSPAFLKAWNFRFVWDELPDKPVYDFPYPCDVEEVIEPDQIYTLDTETTQATSPTPEEIIDALIAGKRYLTVYGFVSYGDIFGSPIRYMKFCKRLYEFDLQRNYTWFMDHGGYEYTGQHEHYDAPNQKWPKIM